MPKKERVEDVVATKPNDRRARPMPLVKKTWTSEPIQEALRGVAAYTDEHHDHIGIDSIRTEYSGSCEWEIALYFEYDDLD